jgi:hypothetical protein
MEVKREREKGVKRKAERRKEDGRARRWWCPQKEAACRITCRVAKT